MAGLRVPTVINAEGRPIARETHPFVKVHMYPQKTPAGHVDPDDLGRALTLLSDNIEEATLPARSSPLSRFVILQQVPLVASPAGLSPPVATAIRHGLSEPFTHYQALRAYQPPGQGVVAFTGLVGGSGYTSAPTVTINGPPKAPLGQSPGIGAQATATVSGGAITSLTISSGFGYQTPPAISFSGGGGSGASCTAVLGTVYSSQAFAVQEVPYNLWPKNPATGRPGPYTPDQHLLVYSFCTGLFDIAVYCG